MFTKQDFLAAVAHETHVLKHLHSKLSDDQLTYSPGENIRNTLDLMRYLAWCGQLPVDAMLNNDWSLVDRYRGAAESMTAEQFPEFLDRQLARIRELLEPLSDDDLAARDCELPWGEKRKLGEALVSLSLQFLCAYRLQFFNHLKASGCTELATPNAWLGMDSMQ